tara:strand:+ start:22295 stop:23521 length:1227 start_codon:yes stop_codon:yes gene_type:complete
MDQTPNLSLSYPLPNQAQKHVTLNESLRRLDALVQLSVISRGKSVQPGAPDGGYRYILPTGASGDAWGGAVAGTLAVWEDGTWVLLVPAEGWRDWIADEDVPVVFNDGDWQVLCEATALFGVNTLSDTTNRFSVKSDVVLLSHNDVTLGTGDARKMINKAATGNTASVVFQNGFSGQAEFGLVGDDRFRLKVSPDGVAFKDALMIDPASGDVGFGAIPKAQVFFAGTNMASSEKGDLHIEKAGYYGLIFLDTYATSAASFSVQRRARGIVTTPLAVMVGDTLGGFSFRGYNPNGAFSQTGLVHVVVDDRVSGSETPGALVLSTGRSSASERMRIASSGRVGIGMASPSCALHVAGLVRGGSSSKAALPGAAVVGAGAVLLVPDQAGGAVLAFSDGTDWRRVMDRAVVS